ncbi:HAMP domain-containing protein [Comamonas granuli]|uniref:HAMP domain-containing protein n=1 Tax=Comamonas granuli TaxID=290309 RepID=UPI0005A7FEE3|nr:HAMP domain-containing protein [Comamonas granuli]
MWNIFRQSIRTQLLFLLCVALLPLLALLFFQNHRERADARNDAFARVRMVAEQTAQRLNQYLVDHEGVLARIAARPGVRALDGQACDPLIHEFVRLFPEYTNLAVQDLQGGNDGSFLERKFTPEMLERVPGYLQAHAADGMTVGGAVWGPVSGRWVASLFYPVRDAQNRTAGLMRLPMDLRVLSERLLPLVPAGTLVVVADAQGRILMRSRDPQDWMGRPVSDAMRALAENPGRGAWAAVPGVDGVERLYAVAAVPRAHWTVYTGVRADEVFAPSHASFARGLALAAGFACLALLLAWRIAQRIVRPIDALHQTTSQVAAGQAQARVAIDGGARELQAVAAEFNRMLDSRERALQELADSESRFRTLSDLSSDWYWEQDAQHRIVRLDGRVAEGTGLPEQVYLGKTRW